MQRDLDKLVEVVRRNLIADARPRKVHSHSTSDELVVGSDNKALRFRNSSRRMDSSVEMAVCGETTIKVVHEHDKGNLQLLQKLLKVRLEMPEFRLVERPARQASVPPNPHPLGPVVASLSCSSLSQTLRAHVQSNQSECLWRSLPPLRPLS